jgi:hypothetical protein
MQPPLPKAKGQLVMEVLHHEGDPDICGSSKLPFSMTYACAEAASPSQIPAAAMTTTLFLIVHLQ